MRSGLKWAGLILLMVFVIPALADGGLLISIEEAVTVKGGSISLAEIATVTGEPDQVAVLETVELGKAPPAGQTRSITRQFVIFRLAQAGLKAGRYQLEMPSQVRVTAASIPLTAENFQRLIKNALVPKVPAEWRSWELKFLSGFTDRLISPGEMSVLVTDGADPLTPGPNLLQVKVRSDDKELLHLAVSVQITATGRVAVLKEDLQRHSLVSPAAWGWEERTLKGSEMMKIPVGKVRTTRWLRQGETLDKNDMEQVPLVEKGAKVLIIYRSNGAAVQTYGLARADGWLGETVPVENIDSKKVIVSVVTGEGQVEVK